MLAFPTEFQFRERNCSERLPGIGILKARHNIRSTINRTIGAEVRAGRLMTDWERVWKGKSSVRGSAEDLSDTRGLQPFASKWSPNVSPCRYCQRPWSRQIMCSWR